MTANRLIKALTPTGAVLLEVTPSGLVLHNAQEYLVEDADNNLVEMQVALDEIYAEMATIGTHSHSTAASGVTYAGGPGLSAGNVEGALDELAAEKADLSYVNTELADKADTTYVDAGLASKADTTYVDAELADKADLSYVNTELADKADLSYVNTELADKADITDAVMQALADVKGDLVVATAANTFTRVPLSGVNGRVLTEDAAEAAGVKWATPAGGGGGGEPGRSWLGI